jgi:hypothetical protein
VQTEESSLIPVHSGKPEKPTPTRFAFASLSELWKLEPSEVIAVNDPVIGDYRYIVSANLIEEANQGLATVEHRPPRREDYSRHFAP